RSWGARGHSVAAPQPVGRTGPHRHRQGGVGDMSDPVGVLLMTYGSAATAEDVPAYLASVRGRPAQLDLIQEFQRRYRLIGFSPLVRITQAQGQALQEWLHAGHDRQSSRPGGGLLPIDARGRAL